MEIPDKCSYCGSQPEVVCSEDSIDGHLQGMVLCFDCMRILSVSSVEDIHGRVSGLLINRAVLEHNAN